MVRGTELRKNVKRDDYDNIKLYTNETKVCVQTSIIVITCIITTALVYRLLTSLFDLIHNLVC